MEHNPNTAENLYEFLKERNFETVKIGYSASEDIYNVFVFLDPVIKKLLLNRLGLEKTPDVCVFSKAKVYQYQKEIVISCSSPHETYKLYSFENNKLKLLKYCMREDNGSLGDRRGIKKLTRQKNFTTKVVKDGWNSYYPMSKSSSKRNNNGKAGEQAPSEITPNENPQTSY